MIHRPLDRPRVFDLTIILDRSGSMEAIRSDVIGAFNRFLAEQRPLPGDCRLTLVQFDDEYEVVYSGRALSDAPDLTADTFQPGGSTALLDAIGRTIRDIDRRLSAVPLGEGHQNVLVAVLTDGLENASSEYTRDRVLEMVKTRTDTGWTFLFLAANQDAIAEAEKVGIGARQSLNFAATGQGIRAGTHALSEAVSEYRTGGSASFSPSSRLPKKVH